MNVKDEVKSLVMAHGFPIEGEYSFKPISSQTQLNENHDSLIDGKVTGSFQIHPDNFEIVLSRKRFNEENWDFLCDKFGFKYQNHEEIIELVISQSGVKVSIDIDTPKSRPITNIRRVDIVKNGEIQ